MHCLYGLTSFSRLTLTGGSEVKASASNAGDLGWIPGLGRSLGEGNGNPLQYSCLENPTDGEAWWATVCGVTKCRTRLSDFTHTHNVMVQAWVGKELPDMRQNEREIELIRVGDAVRTVG